MSSCVDHARAARTFAADDARMHWHDRALWFVREKRDRQAGTLPEWEDLRELGEGIKAHTLSRLPDYLEEFERAASDAGAVLHWAADADEHNRIVHGLLAERGAQKLVKSKSMLTEECGLNPYLEARGIEVVDTDLGERIVQLGREHPSHIVLPAIHRDRSDVGTLFHEHLGTPADERDPERLTRAARADLRSRFLAADAALTGVNFAVAENGCLVICTNEGNADIGVALPKLHIACMGMEKLLPRMQDLAVFTRLLARSATGQPITTYTSHFRGPRPGGELHIVIVDNGRSRHFAEQRFRSSLSCIRCGACMNTCPVYRRSGGHSYGWTVPGPIGIILAPHRSPSQYRHLPYASSMCGSCSEVCPVRIDIHEQILQWRGEIGRRGLLPWHKRLALQLAGRLLRSRRLYECAGRWGRRLLRWSPAPLRRLLGGPWTRQRELPPTPARSFRDWWAQDDSVDPSADDAEGRRT